MFLEDYRFISTTRVSTSIIVRAQFLLDFFYCITKCPTYKSSISLPSDNVRARNCICPVFVRVSLRISKSGASAKVKDKIHLKRNKNKIIESKIKLSPFIFDSFSNARDAWTLPFRKSFLPYQLCCNVSYDRRGAQKISTKAKILKTLVVRMVLNFLIAPTALDMIQNALLPPGCFSPLLKM